LLVFFTSNSSVRHSDKKYQSPLLLLYWQGIFLKVVRLVKNTNLGVISTINILLQIVFLTAARLVKNTNPGVRRAPGVRHN